MRVLVTGGAGYLGTELVHALARRDDVEQIVVYDNLSSGNHSLFVHRPLARPVARFVRGDILDLRTLRSELAGVDVVYHLAAKVSTPFRAEDPHAFEQINHWGCAELAAAVEDSDVSRLIHVSTTAVYGYTTEPVDESARCSPQGHYGIAKHRGERQMLRLADRVQTYVVRCGNVYGYSPSMRFDAVINRLMFEANYSSRISVYSTGHQTRAFVHVDRATAGLLAMLDGALPPGVYNMVEDNHSVLELSALLQEIYPDLEIIFVDQHMAIGSLIVAPNARLAACLAPRGASLGDELRDFAAEFAFRSLPRR